MDIFRERIGAAEILRANGQIIRGVGDQALRASFLEVIREGCTRCVLDLSQVRFMDSAALGETVAGFKRLHAADGHLALVVARGGEVEKVIRLTALDRVLDVHYDLDAALAGPGGLSG